MASVSVSSDVNVNVDLSEEEISVLKKAHGILKELSTELWQDDADETETFSYVSTAQDAIYSFLKQDCGINVDEKRWW